VGYLVAPNALLYALGGYTQAKFDGQVNLSFGSYSGSSGGASIFVNIPQTLSLSVPDELQGYLVGGGGELKVSDHIALRIEYRYANYAGETNSASASFKTSFGGGVFFSQTA
jgi:outer membrane immunogenic protein